MPIFEFECRACGHPFERLVLPWLASASEPPSCPSCQSTNVERTLSICAVSSDSTRKASLQKAKTRLRAVTREKETEEQKAILEHAQEHH